jgi:TPR repeat protein
MRSPKRSATGGGEGDDFRIGVLRTARLALLLAGLVCTSSISGQEPKAPAPESLDWLRGRAEKGNPAAQYNLGVNYAKGQGVPQDYAEALGWSRVR